jgi:hypothetical protein
MRESDVNFEDRDEVPGYIEYLCGEITEKCQEIMPLSHLLKILDAVKEAHELCQNVTWGR